MASLLRGEERQFPPLISPAVRINLPNLDPGQRNTAEGVVLKMGEAPA
jgi:hypothetical protein